MTEQEKQAALEAFNRIYDHLDACEVMADNIHKDMNIIAEVLKRNAVHVIEGLDDAISHLEDIDREIRRFGARDLFSVYKMSIPANLKTDSDFLVLKVIQAARAYAELQKGI